MEKLAMEKLDRYRPCIETLLERESHYKSKLETVESELFFDPVRHHYQLMCIGWQGLKRVYHTVMHFDSTSKTTKSGFSKIQPIWM